MNSRWATLMAAILVAFGSCVIAWQARHRAGVEGQLPVSVVHSFVVGNKLAGITNILVRSYEPVPISRTGWYYDLALPTNARVFMTGMTGPTNFDRVMYYYYMTYYLFPREVGTSLDHLTRLTKDGLVGRTSESNHEILTNGYDVRFDFSPSRLGVTALRDFTVKFPANPSWFDSAYDKIIAFLLPLFTTLAGMWLFRLLFPTLTGQMLLREQWASGLGLGMMAVAALTLGVKLCGFHGYHLIFFTTGAAALLELWHNRKSYRTRLVDGCKNLVQSPLLLVLLAAGLIVFLVLFRMAGLQGVVEYDAVMAWMPKAKMIHLYTGNALVQWFSNPRLAHAHLDYPTLVPSLHAATFDSLGHIDEFVTKFWPAWMLFFLLAALTALCRAGNGWRPVLAFALLGILLLPVTQGYVQMEGGTVPMIFFTVLGFVQCTRWLIGKDRARLGLGLTFLFGAAMAKFEGFIFLALVGSWLLLMPAARPSLRPLPPFGKLPAFWLLAALPFVLLRMQIPVLHFESGWAGYALHHPVVTLSNWPWIFMILYARLFVSSDFADWTGMDGRLHWVGRWDGLTSLYDHFTLGLAWFCLLMTVVLWFAVPSRRPILAWMLTMLVGALAAFSLVFASFMNITSLQAVIGYTASHIAGRYLLPLLLAWFATILTLFFTGPLVPASTGVPETGAADAPGSSGGPEGQFPALKGGSWLVAGALLILVFGVFVLPESKPASPGDSAQMAVATPATRGAIGLPENADLLIKMRQAAQLDQSGQFAQALQAYREAARLYPTNALALNKLAWSLAMNPVKELRDGPEAVRLAGEAVELTGHQDPACIKTLAAAYAQDGQMSKALETAQNALAIAVLQDNPKEGVAINHLLELLSSARAAGLTNNP